MLILTFLTGVAAHGLMVFAQKTIQIGTIGIAQVAQPALAVVWSFLLARRDAPAVAGRRHRHRHERLAGLLAVEPAPERGRAGPARRARVEPGRALSSLCRSGALACRSRVDSVEVGDEVRGGLHPPIGGRTEVAAPWRCRRRRQRPGPAHRGRTPRPERRPIAEPRRGSRRVARPAPGTRRLRPWRRAGTRRARPARRRRRRDATRSPPRARLAPAAARPTARRTRPRWTRARATSRTSPMASRLVDRELQGGRSGVVVAGLALRPAEARELVCLGLRGSPAAATSPRRGRCGRRRRRNDAGGEPARRAWRHRARAATGRPPSRSQA